MPKFCARAALLVAYILPFAGLTAQQSSNPPLPQDPAALMALAHDQNGLTGPNIHPWHIRGSYTFYDKDGTVERTGTYEEWWASPQKYKRIFNSSKFSQTEYGNGAQILRDGAHGWPDGYEMLARSLLLEPIPDPAVLKSFDLKAQAVDQNNIKLSCVWAEYTIRVPMNASPYPGYCFNANLPVLQLQIAGAKRKTVYNKLVSFQGHYLAREIHDLFDGKPVIDLTVDMIEGLKEQNVAQLTPPSNAQPVDLSSTALADSDIRRRWPRVLRAMPPEYPPLAKDHGTDGTVVLHATIEKDGHVDNVKAISGPLMLQSASIDAASQWIYMPVVLLGEPRAVNVEMKIIYSINSHIERF